MATKTLQDTQMRQETPESRKRTGAAIWTGKTAMAKWVYSFGDGKAEGRSEMRNLLGGKGANLAEMAGLGLPVPPGFTLTTEVCTYFYANKNTYPPDLKGQVTAALDRVGEITGKTFGDPANPLLVSVRSGARASMPGMMDTVLNLGLNDVTVEAIAKNRPTAASPMTAIAASSTCIATSCSALDTITSRRFSRPTRTARVTCSTPISTPRTGSRSSNGYKQCVIDETGKPFPQDPHEQLWGAIGAVFGSWMNARAITYRRLHGIPESWGTAVNVQAMVFGNMGDTSATGVAFTRNPSTGEKRLYGEFLINAQGEDVVAGIRTPQEIMRGRAHRRRAPTSRRWRRRCRSRSPSSIAIYSQLERHYRDMQDLEFTVEQGKLWMLQTRAGKRTAHGGAEDRRRPGERGPDHPRGGGGPDRSGGARPAAASDHRSQGRAQDHRHRAPGIARRRLRRDRVLVRRGRGVEERRAARSSWCASRRRRKTFTA